MLRSILCSLLIVSVCVAQCTPGPNCTPNIGFNIPPYNTGNWNTLMNENWSWLDSVLSGGLLPLTLANPGVFATGLNSNFVVNINSCNLVTELAGAPVSSSLTNAITGCVHGTAGAISVSTGVLGIGVSEGTAGAFGGLFIGHADANDVIAIGVNADAWDTTNAGFSNMEMVGVNSAVAATNASNAYEILDGSIETAVFTNQPNLSWSGGSSTLVGNAYHCLTANTHQWNRCLLSDPGAAAVGAHFDGQCQLGSSNNCSSQFVEFAGVNAGSRGNAAAIGADKNGNLLVATQSGGVFVSNAAPRLFSTLPTCTSGIEGAMAPITDDNTSGTWGATEGGGSAGHHVLVYCDGTNWTVMAK